MTGGRPANGGPLRGVKVLDLTQMLSGPYCSMMLADLGADVVKVESPSGDFIRAAGPQRSSAELYGAYFQSINRGKRSIVIDLKRDDGKQLLLKLVSQVDVVLENFRAGVMDRLGLSYERLQASNSRLVYGCIRGFGDPRTGESPYLDWPAYDIVAQAMGGLMGITGELGGTPLKAGPGVGDTFPGALLAIGVLAALMHVRAGGDGQLVDVSMYDGIVSLCERIVYQYSCTGESPSPQGNTHPIFEPYGVYRCRDGWVALAAPTDGYWGKLCRLTGLRELTTNPMYATIESRRRNATDLREALGRWFVRETVASVVDLMGGHVPIAPVHTAEDLFRDPHLKIRKMLIELAQPGTDETVTVAGSPIKFTGTQRELGRRAPLLAEDTDVVLAEAGFDALTIQSLRDAGTIC